MQTLSFQADATFVATLEHLAKLRGIPVADVIRHAVALYKVAIEKVHGDPGTTICVCRGDEILQEFDFG